MKSLEETVKEQGGEEFLAMVKEVMMWLLIDNTNQTNRYKTNWNLCKSNHQTFQVGLLSKLQENMTVFVPTNEAVEEFHRNLMEFNTLELETPEKNEVIAKAVVKTLNH